MARTTATNFSGGLQFPYATAATDIFKKEDLQTLAQAVDQHDHTAGKGHSIITTPANASITNAMLGSDVARANLLTNGSFEIWQRGNGPFTTALGPDRWNIVPEGTDTFSVSRDTTNMAAGNACAAVTYVHGNGTGQASITQSFPNADVNVTGRTLTLSMQVRTSVASAVRLRAFSNPAAVYTNGAFHSGSGAYETLTVTMAVAAGQTSFFCGVYFSASCTAYIDGAMLVIGSQAADYVPLHPSDDLARCLRYYEIIGETAAEFQLGAYGSAASTVVQQPMTYKARKAVSPTVTIATGWGLGGTAAQPTVSGAGVSALSFQTVTTGAGMAYLSNPAKGFTVESNP